MDTMQLCRDIGLPEVLTEEIRALEAVARAGNGEADAIGRNASMYALLSRLRGADKADADRAYNELKEFLGDDPRGIKMLHAQLTALLDTRAEFAKRGIGDAVFVDTMGCFARFCGEHFVSHGGWGFDRGWWTWRFLGMRIFRLGVLEFEMEGTQLSVHIPSDAVMTREALDDSYARAGRFFAQFFPEFACEGIFCHTWLLSPNLKEMLPPGSRILLFGEDYEIVYADPDAGGGMRWIFKREYPDLASLPEETTLQRAVKARLLAGKKVGSARGRYRGSNG